MLKQWIINPIIDDIRWKYHALRLYSRNHTVKLQYMAKFHGGSLGKHVFLGREVYCSEVDLGDYSYIGSHSIVTMATIGKFCSIGHQVLIGVGTHPVKNAVSTHPAFYSPHPTCGISFVNERRFNERSKIRIGNDVWIGTRAVVLDGVTIGDGAIIAACAVVTKDVSPYTIVGGVPAKIIRTRFDEETIYRIRNSRWWDQDIDWLKEHANEMLDITSFMRCSQSVKLPPE